MIFYEVENGIEVWMKPRTVHAFAALAIQVDNLVTSTPPAEAA